jgi:hypothetical protein
MQKQKTIKQKSIRMEGEHMHAQRHFRSAIKPSLNLQNLLILEYCCPVFVKSPGVFSLSRQHYAQWQGC